MEPQLFRIDPKSDKTEALEEVEFAQIGFQERRNIQEWIAKNPSILGEKLLIIAKEFSDFDRTKERLDLLAVDKRGRLVIIELKRDDSGRDAHWQAIKYASYLSNVKEDVIAGILANYKGGMSLEDAKSKIMGHLGADDLDGLNNGQRIILASHRFAPEVTSAALWLNRNTPDKTLITCVQLTPYQDGKDGPLYIQANTIIPVPGSEAYTITVGPLNNKEEGQSGSGFAVKMAETKASHNDDDVTEFLMRVGDLATEGMPEPLRPTRRSKWGRRWGRPSVWPPTVSLVVQGPATALGQLENVLLHTSIRQNRRRAKPMAGRSRSLIITTATLKAWRGGLLTYRSLMTSTSRTARCWLRVAGRRCMTISSQMSSLEACATSLRR